MGLLGWTVNTSFLARSAKVWTLFETSRKSVARAEPPDKKSLLPTADSFKLILRNLLIKNIKNYLSTKILWYDTKKIIRVQDLNLFHDCRFIFTFVTSFVSLLFSRLGMLV